METMKLYSLIIPVYGNAQNISELFVAIEKINGDLSKNLEVVFVVDGNIENEFELLQTKLKNVPFAAQLISHSKNFGSFAAIKTGLEHAKGQFFVIMSADLQESPQLIVSFFNKLSGKNNINIVIGNRVAREDSFLNTIFSKIHWYLYSKFIQKDAARSGVDVFGCDATVRNILVNLKENNTSLIGLLFWVGFKRELVDYSRRKRMRGKSMWSLNKKMKYFIDSVFGFSDFPVIILLVAGLCGILISLILSIIILISKISGAIAVPGYTATLLIVFFFSSLNLFSFGIIGLYIWRTFENTKNRPNAIVMKKKIFN
jgi:glycosyltransferase involved in cell wall biosynthesis